MSQSEVGPAWGRGSGDPCWKLPDGDGDGPEGEDERYGRGPLSLRDAGNFRTLQEGAEEEGDERGDTPCHAGLPAGKRAWPQRCALLDESARASRATGRSHRGRSMSMGHGDGAMPCARTLLGSNASNRAQEESKDAEREGREKGPEAGQMRPGSSPVPASSHGRPRILYSRIKQRWHGLAA